MPVIKGQLAKYRVIRNGECATIALGDWANPKAEGKAATYSGELLVHSSFGNFSYTWRYCALPFKQFLATIDQDSFMRKCLGDAYREYSGNETVLKLKRALLQLRRAGVYSADRARDAWDSFCVQLDEAETSESGFYRAVKDVCGASTPLGDAEAYLCYQPNPQALGFWNKLWPDFVEELKKELALPEAVQTEQENEATPSAC